MNSMGKMIVSRKDSILLVAFIMGKKKKILNRSTNMQTESVKYAIQRIAID